MVADSEITTSATEHMSGIDAAAICDTCVVRTGKRARAHVSSQIKCEYGRSAQSEL
jgi:hypothetical protein